MSYEIGSYVDLRYLNKKRQTKQSRGGFTAGQFRVDIGTSFKLRRNETGFTSWRVIPIVTA